MFNSGGSLKEYTCKSFGRVNKDKRHLPLNGFESMEYKFFDMDLFLSSRRDVLAAFLKKAMKINKWLPVSNLILLHFGIYRYHISTATKHNLTANMKLIRNIL